ncbi:UDP-N-acetylmuramate--L-alanine ligase [Abyssalbus ytuae]|uniref:UDP-N-acetylmuramate--L-alanine ligase n=1 Tax=Abyssalbus ytuae TaxID=2926907 RepID=A0A9E7D0K0_9FLAO|nr:UDP-N-acetylmuramate--L-alanine ligase [Abyssalbus ytuae]UOB18490.1 UDP-N-acetylmuramate--L-alanine ligase [Abyssalbus ytuae]
MNLKNIHNVYFLGIGGIGMSALARYFKFIGKNVAGYDKTPSEITEGLQSAGMYVHFDDNLMSIPAGFKEKNKTLIVYTPAIPKDHGEYNYFKDNGFEIYKRAQVLGFITKDSFCFAVAGTHGKTTTSSILAHILKETGMPLTAFLGGVSENFNSNFLTEGDKYTVVEADEFDRSFLHLFPDIACVTSMDADHLDIYGEKKELEKSFIEFTKKIKPGGKLFLRKGIPLEGITYGIEDDSDYCIKNIKIKNATYVFDVVTPFGNIEGVKFNKPGQHNLLNALAAFAMAAQINVPPDRLAMALESFKGVKRRFSYHIQTEYKVYIDDYAHHPTEIEAVYHAVKEMYPDKKVLAIFQPHLYSRTRDFIEDFAKSLSKFDEIILLDIYPAREQPIEGVTSQWLLNKINNPNKQLISKDELPSVVKHTSAFVILTLGAGDIGEEVKKIKEALLNEN